MVSISVKVPAALLLVSLILFGMIVPVSAQELPLNIKGYVNVNGVATSGVQVTSNGASYTTTTDSSGRDGYYNLALSNIANGSQVTVNFNYNGHSASVSVTSNGYAVTAPTANIVYQTATPTPSATATPSATVTATPTASAQSGNSGSQGSSSVETVYATATPTPKVTVTVQPTYTVTLAPTIAPTQTPTSTPDATAMPSATADAASSNTLLLISILAGIGIIGVVAGAYLLLRRQ